MLGYTIVGTANLERATVFFAPLFARMGLERCYSDKFVVSWGDRSDDTVPRFFVCYPFDEQPASVGNGTMTAFRVKHARDVDWLHAKALKHGGTDDGAPGLRPERYGDAFYVAYVRDPDGNKFAFYSLDGQSIRKQS